VLVVRNLAIFAEGSLTEHSSAGLCMPRMKARKDRSAMSEIPAKVVLRGKPSGRSRWAAGSKAARADPKGAHSKSPGLAAPIRFYVRGLQARPSVSFHRQG
jgi:hypothetical protein